MMGKQKKEKKQEVLWHISNFRRTNFQAVSVDCFAAPTSTRNIQTRSEFDSYVEKITQKGIKLIKINK
jgi:hypothetical protein